MDLEDFDALVFRCAGLCEHSAHSVGQGWGELFGQEGHLPHATAVLHMSANLLSPLLRRYRAVQGARRRAAVHCEHSLRELAGR